MSETIARLDVREDVLQGREPFSKIMNLASRLGPNEKFLLIAPFEPLPLFSVLDRQGFDQASKKLQSGDWEVLFTRRNVESSPGFSPQRPGCSAVKAEAAEIVELDARGLEPPQPMIKILEALATLPPGAELRARTDRRPMHLYAQLEERGFAGETSQELNESFITTIRSR